MDDGCGGCETGAAVDCSAPRPLVVTCTVSKAEYDAAEMRLNGSSATSLSLSALVSCSDACGGLQIQIMHTQKQALKQVC